MGLGLASSPAISTASATSPDPARVGRTPILLARRLVKHFVVRRPLIGKPTLVHAVDGIDLRVDQGETGGLVGESGSGKTTAGRCLLRPIEPTEGEIYLQGRDILRLGGRPLRILRRKMKMVFQDPGDSLNPRFTCRRTLTGALRSAGLQWGRARRRRSSTARSPLTPTWLVACAFGRGPLMDATAETSNFLSPVRSRRRR